MSTRPERTCACCGRRGKTFRPVILGRYDDDPWRKAYLCGRCLNGGHYHPPLALIEFAAVKLLTRRKNDTWPEHLAGDIGREKVGTYRPDLIEHSR